MNLSNYTNVLIHHNELSNPCPSQRAISRPLLFVHNYSLFVFGSVLNILAFIILMQRSLRCHSTFAYLAFLSLSNGVLSLVRFTQWMFTYYLHIHVEDYLYTCRFYHFALDFLTHFSLFTLVCVNIDRARTVTRNRPSTKFSQSTFHMVLIKESIIAITLSAYHFHWLVKFGHEVFDGTVKRTICNYLPNKTSPLYIYFLSTIYPPFELVIFFCCPLLINMICTILIVRSLHLRMRTAKRFNRFNHMIIHSEQNKFLKELQRIFACIIPRTTTKSNIYTCCCCQIQCRRHTELRVKVGRSKRSLLKYEEKNDSSDRQQSSTLTSDALTDLQQLTTITATILNKNRRTRRIRDIHLSAMLIVLNVLYLICNLPFNFHQTFARKIHKNNPDSCIMKFTNLLFDTLQQTYFSTNFFLYVLTNRRFREEFYNTMMKICRRKQQYLLKKNIQQRQQRSLSLLPSTGLISNFNGDYQVNSTRTQENRYSVVSDMELIEPTTQQQQQQSTVLIEDDKNKSISKLVIFDNLSNEIL